MSKILKLKPIHRARLIQVMNHIILSPETWQQKRWHCGSSHCFCGWGQVFANDVHQSDEFDFLSWGATHFGLPRQLSSHLFEASNTMYELYRCVKHILAGGYDEDGCVLNEDLDQLGFYYRDGICPAGYTRQGELAKGRQPVTLKPIDHEDHDDCMGQLIIMHNMIIAVPELLNKGLFNDHLALLYPVMKNLSNSHISGYLDCEEWHITALNAQLCGLNKYMISSLIHNIIREFDEGETFDHDDPERPYDKYFFDKNTGFNNLGFNREGYTMQEMVPMQLITLT